MRGMESVRKTGMPPWAEKRKYRKRSRMPTDGRLLLEKNLLRAKHPNPYAAWENERLIREAQSKANTRIELVLADASLYLQLYVRNALDRAYPEEANGNKARR